MTAFSDRWRTVKARVAERRAERRATKGERLRRRAEANALRIESKRMHESDPRGGGGGGG